MATARRLVEAIPNIAPVPFGLLSVAQVTDDSDEHWQNGVIFAANASVFDDHAEIQSAASVIVSGNAVDDVEAIGLLEGALASCYPGLGVIHVPRAAIAHLSDSYQLNIKGEKLYTQGGTNVVAG